MNVGDTVTWLLSRAQARGRGSHLRAYGLVTKVNAKTVDVTERPGSYRPGTLWRVPKAELQIYNT